MALVMGRVIADGVGWVLADGPCHNMWQLQFLDCVGPRYLQFRILPLVLEKNHIAPECETKSLWSDSLRVKL